MTKRTKEQQLAKRREWYQKNKQKQAEYNRRYWQRKLSQATEPVQDVPAESVTE